MSIEKLKLKEHMRKLSLAISSPFISQQEVENLLGSNINQSSYRKYNRSLCFSFLFSFSSWFDLPFSPSQCNHALGNHEIPISQLITLIWKISSMEFWNYQTCFQRHIWQADTEEVKTEQNKPAIFAIHLGCADIWIQS